MTSDGTSTFTYDVENRLVGRSGGVTLRYDPLGRLWQVTGASGTTTFLYDGDALVGEYNAAGTLLRRYVHGAGADIPLLSYEGATLANPRYLHADRQGSIVAVSDGAGGSLTINRYDEYGIPAASNVGRFQYTGQIWLAELGMYHYKARMYSPTLGRMMQTDPVGYEDQFNLYAYVGNDPVNRTDPTGLATYDCRGGVGAGNCNRGTVLREGDVVRTRYGNLGISRGDGFTIARPLQSGTLSSTQVTAIVFNETRSLHGDRIGRARRNLAHAVRNGDALRGPRRPITASDATPNFTQAERADYENARNMVRRGDAERSLGYDPTQGSIYFRVRGNNSMRPHPDFGTRVRTHDGPFTNSFPNRDTPATSGIFVDTFRESDE